MVARADIHNGSAGWHPFGLTDEDFKKAEERGGVKWVNVKLGNPDRSAAWLRGAMLALAALAAAAAAVSFEAQYVMVASVKHSAVIAALEAAIPDVGALIFAALGIALALHGKRAIRARTLNVACVGISLAMNALASAPGWRDMAIWVMPSALYALASDTLIGVIRAWALARKRDRGETLADDDTTPLAILGGAALWLLRLALAPPSTLGGFRAWVVEECPVAPGRKGAPALPVSPNAPALPPPSPNGHEGIARTRRRRQRRDGRAGKQDRLIALATKRYDLTAIDLGRLAPIARQLAAEIGLHPGTARRVLRSHVQALQAATDDQPGVRDRRDDVKASAEAEAAS
jgi:hypothetical protein